MISVLRNFWPGSSSKNDDHDDEYSLEYSFAMEYSGPLVNHEIPQVVLVDVHRIPTAAVAAKAAMMSNLAIPVLQPVSRKGDKSSAKESNSRIGKSGRIYSRKLESFSEREGALEEKTALEEKASSEPNVFVESSSSSGTLRFSDGCDDSNRLSASSDDEEKDDENKAKKWKKKKAKLKVKLLSMATEMRL